MSSSRKTVIGKKSGKQASEIDFILVATVTPDFNMPSVACQVQGAIGATEAFCFLTSVQSVFWFCLCLKHGRKKLVLSGRYQTGLVIGGETFFQKCWIGPIAPQRCFFGDGAAGVLIEAAETPHFLNEKNYKQMDNGGRL